MKIAFILGLLSCLTLPLIAQEKSETPESTPVKKYDPSGKKEYQQALIFKKAGEYEKALSLIEKASFKESNALYLFEYALLLDLMGDTGQAMMVLDRNAEAIKAHPQITTYSLVRQKFQNKIDAGKTVEKSPSLVAPILTITGAATTIAGVVFIVLANSAENELRCNKNISIPSRSCDNPTRSFTKQKYEEAKSDVEFSNTLGWGLTGLGVALAGAGTYLWLSDDTSVSAAINPIHQNYMIGIKTTF